MEKTMTIKEIAELCGLNSTKTVLNWIKGDGQKLTEIGQKLTKAQETKKPARFNIEEVIEIVRAGGNETLANLLMENAKENINEITPKDNYLEIINNQMKLINNQMEVIKKLVENEKVNEPKSENKILIEDKNTVWITTIELAGLLGCTRATAISRALRAGWDKRASSLRGYLTHEYNLNSLPTEVQEKYSKRQEEK
ncbi:MAG TPA: hypothetical protein PK771_11425 [Spirochaetota bacterium]|nr:hypothetical protein [Spirochaetota bacterium]